MNTAINNKIATRITLLEIVSFESEATLVLFVSVEVETDILYKWLISVVIIF